MEAVYLVPQAEQYAYGPYPEEAEKVKVDSQRSVEAPVEMFQLARELDPELGHWLLGQAMKRIRRYCQKYDSDADPLIMMREVEQDFVTNGYNFLIVVAVRDLRIVGHLLVDRYVYHGCPYAAISQFQLDEQLTLDQEKKAFEIVLNWCKQIDIRGLRAVVDRKALRNHPKAVLRWYRQFGFVRKRSIFMEYQNGRR